MGFILFSPVSGKSNDVETSASVDVQLWQELTMLRFASGTKGMYGKLITAPWIDQSKVYYLDALKSSWNSAGLLYYYSFLNLAKALIVSKRAVTGAKLKSSSSYHGLSAKPQAPKSLADFEIEIHPPNASGSRNVFATFYESIIGVKWPFASKIAIKASEFMPYCFDISHELTSFYSTPQRIVHCHSLLREVNQRAWIEFILPHNLVNEFLGYFPPNTFNVVLPQNLSQTDHHDWLLSHGRSANSFSGLITLRTADVSNAANRPQQLQQLGKDFVELMKSYSTLGPKASKDGEFDISLKCKIGGLELFWHPLLSDYLFAFVLSTILRYYPHIFDSSKRDGFVAQAWCNQSPITTLRYFLMLFTTPSIRMN